MLDESAVIALQLFALGVQIRYGLIERQHADVLEQGGQEYFLRQRLVHGIGERARGRRRQQGAAPIQAIVKTVGFAAP